MTTREALAATERHYRSMQEAAEQAREARDAAIREAIAARWTHARIADATGLTRGRIGQIAKP